MPSSSTNTYHLTIHDLPSAQRPRERLQHYGPNALSDAELLAILLRTGIRGENVVNLSTRLLVEQGGLLGLAKAGFNQLARLKGLGPAKTCQVKAALELGRRLTIVTPEQRPQINSPADAANLLMAQMAVLEQEHLRLLLLDTKHYVITSPTIYVGNVNTSVIRVAEVYKEAIKEHATALIVAHNHPSGDPTPSPEDIHVTKRLIEAGKLLDIELLDHIVIGRQRFVSLKERGLAF